MDLVRFGRARPDSKRQSAVVAPGKTRHADCFNSLMKPHRHAAIALALLVVSTANGALAQATRTRSLFPEGGAAIEHLLLHFDPTSGSEWLPTYRDLARSLPAAVRFTVAVQGAAELEQLNLLLATAARPTKPEVLMVGKQVTAWARDRMIAVGGDTPSDLLTPRTDRVGEAYLGDLAAAGALADREGRRSVPVAMAFEGGDILYSGKRVFIGANTIRSNTESASWAEVIRDFERLLCAKVVVVGTPVPPHDHLDMYLSILDEDTVMLGDPASGRALLKRILRQSPAVTLPSFDSWTPTAQQAMQSLYDEICRDLRGRGLRVLRVPILHGVQGGLLTWNNVLIERRGLERRVYLPIYGVKEFDDAAIQAYRDADCNVFPIDVSGMAHNGGTVRCLTNVIGWTTDLARAPNVTPISPTPKIPPR